MSDRSISRPAATVAGLAGHGPPDVGISVVPSPATGLDCWRPGSGGEEADLDADGAGDAGEVAGVAGHDRGLVPDGGNDDDGIHDVGGTGTGQDRADLPTIVERVDGDPAQELGKARLTVATAP